MNRRNDNRRHPAAHTAARMAAVILAAGAAGVASASNASGSFDANADNSQKPILPEQSRKFDTSSDNAFARKAFNNQLTVQDVADYTAARDAKASAADFNSDGAVDSLDDDAFRTAFNSQAYHGGSFSNAFGPIADPHVPLPTPLQRAWNYVRNPSDLNGNGHNDFQDVQLFMSALERNWIEADLNRDGAFNGQDVNDFVSRFDFQPTSEQDGELSYPDWVRGPEIPTPLTPRPGASMDRDASFTNGPIDWQAGDSNQPSGQPNPSEGSDDASELRPGETEATGSDTGSHLTPIETREPSSPSGPRRPTAGSGSPDWSAGGGSSGF